MADQEQTLYEIRNGAAWITLNRPEVRNALSAVLINEVSDHLDAAQADPAVRCIVLTGAGKGFCSGADLKNRQAPSGRAVPYPEVLTKIWEGEKPVIARINGACFGAGLETAASCDLRIASDTARFGMPETVIDLPSVIEAALFPRLIGWGRTAWLVYRGDAIDAATAQDWGLVERAVPAAELDDAVDELVDVIKALRTD